MYLAKSFPDNIQMKWCCLVPWSQTSLVASSLTLRVMVKRLKIPPQHWFLMLLETNGNHISSTLQWFLLGPDWFFFACDYILHLATVAFLLIEKINSRLQVFSKKRLSSYSLAYNLLKEKFKRTVGCKEPQVLPYLASKAESRRVAGL